jgi:carbonic anhydrase/acetyltransferase-like protein (isoleucine patch superfamily)
MTLRNFEQHSPDIHPSAYIDESAIVIGQVSIGKASSVWPLSVIRGDIQRIYIGQRTNIQDGSVLHVTHGSEYSIDAKGYPLTIGDDVTVGHKAVLHACTIENRCLIGMGAIILDEALVCSEVIIGAGSIVPSKKILESGYLWLGSPVKRVRKLSTKERHFLQYSAKHYTELAVRSKT